MHASRDGHTHTHTHERQGFMQREVACKKTKESRRLTRLTLLKQTKTIGTRQQRFQVALLVAICAAALAFQVASNDLSSHAGVHPQLTCCCVSGNIVDRNHVVSSEVAGI